MRESMAPRTTRLAGYADDLGGRLALNSQGDDSPSFDTMGFALKAGKKIANLAAANQAANMTNAAVASTGGDFAPSHVIQRGSTSSVATQPTMFSNAFSGASAGYTGAQLFEKYWGKKLEGGSQGLRMTVGGLIGGLAGGPIGAAFGAFAGGFSAGAPRAQTYSQIKHDIGGEVWNSMYGSASEDWRKWISSKPNPDEFKTSKDFFDDLRKRAREAVDSRNELEKAVRSAIYGDKTPTRSDWLLDPKKTTEKIDRLELEFQMAGGNDQKIYYNTIRDFNDVSHPELWQRNIQKDNFQRSLKDIGGWGDWKLRLPPPTMGVENNWYYSDPLDVLTSDYGKYEVLDPWNYEKYTKAVNGGV